MVRVRADLRGINILLSNVEQQLVDFRPLWSRIINRVLNPRIRSIFTSNGNGQWPQRVDTLPHPLLRKSGRLFRSLTNTSHPDNINRQSRTSLVYGSRVPYHIVHEEGRGRVPARPVLGLLAEDETLERDIEREVDNYFQERINRIGG